MCPWTGGLPHPCRALGCRAAVGSTPACADNQRRQAGWLPCHHTWLLHVPPCTPGLAPEAQRMLPIVCLSFVVLLVRAAQPQATSQTHFPILTLLPSSLSHPSLASTPRWRDNGPAVTRARRSLRGFRQQPAVLAAPGLDRLNPALSPVSDPCMHTPVCFLYSSFRSHFSVSPSVPLLPALSLPPFALQCAPPGPPWHFFQGAAAVVGSSKWLFAC